MLVLRQLEQENMEKDSRWWLVRCGKLAEQSNEATKQIQEMIHGIEQTETEKTVLAMSETITHTQTA